MTTSESIRQHGAQAVYNAATRHMAGDTARGLASVGRVLPEMHADPATTAKVYERTKEVRRKSL